MLIAGVFMKNLFILSLCLVIVAFTGQVQASSSQQVVVDDIRVEPMNYTNDEYTWLLVSCSVQNLTDKAGTVSVVVRSIDHWAFDRKPFTLTGQVQAGEKARLSVLHVMESKMFKTLRRYEVKSVELH